MADCCFENNNKNGKGYTKAPTLLDILSEGPAEEITLKFNNKKFVVIFLM